MPLWLCDVAADALHALDMWRAECMVAPFFVHVKSSPPGLGDESKTAREHFREKNRLEGCLRLKFILSGD